ncbi:S9 family peptidase [Steroidobacter sp. S1-65]|uniref:S9 family peptidase n=1 Tax=Steroidobacter gossypii TaxID=2805490 RepID=A0ABS1WR98_9GAMM|nr:alpha/beta fold hydrolase [Steroidobacter gossypii]MBM0103495.1 S9 family peptidase [Steroidobacter gossypii]
MSAVVLSPNGKQLAWFDNREAGLAVQVIDVSANAQLQVMRPGPGVKFRSLDWADDDTLLIHSTFTYVPAHAPQYQHERYRISALNVRTGKSLGLLNNQGSPAGAELLAIPVANPNKVVMASWDFSRTNYRQELGSRLSGGRKDAGFTYNVYEVDITTGEGKLLSKGTPWTTDWIVNEQGEPIARTEWLADRKRFSVVRRDAIGWTEIYSLESDNPPEARSTTQDGAILLVGALGRERSALWRLPIEGGAPQVLAASEQYEISALESDPYTHRVHGAWLGGIDPTIQWLDDKAAKRNEGLRKTFGGLDAQLIGRSSDYTRALVYVAGSGKPGTYYLIDYKRGAADIVGELYPELANVTLGEVRSFSYKARDGYEIPAYLTLPPGKEAKQLALVVLPHGGPQSRDTADFDWQTQFLASRGYAVLQPQFRGSSGFGVAHAKAGFRQWGGLMQDDVTDGVKVLVEQGLADPRRICIVGASYGGYAALAGAAFTPDLYACAVSINGVSDLPAMLGYERSWGKESDAVAYWTDHIGAPTDANVIAMSPARAAARIRAPILLLHGTSDSVVPMEQAQLMENALRSAGKQVRFVELPSEDHWLSRGDSRFRVLTELEKFLSEHLAPKLQGAD